MTQATIGYGKPNETATNDYERPSGCPLTSWDSAVLHFSIFWGSRAKRSTFTLPIGPFNLGPWWTWLGSEGVTMKVDRWIRTQGTFITHGMFGSFLNPDFSSRLEEWDGGDNVAHAVNWNFGRWKGFAGNSEDFSGFRNGRREKNLIAFPDGRLEWGMEGWVRGMSTKLCTWCAFAYFSRLFLPSCSGRDCNLMMMGSVLNDEQLSK